MVVITSKLEILKLLRSKRIIEARKSFWGFCNVIAPDFYKEDREHLKTICNTLQALYEGRIIRYSDKDKWVIKDNLNGLEGYEVCKRLIMNLPPQHGKSRTLVNFADWVFGKNPKEKIITGSYNDETAGDFSRFVRDGIQTKKLAEIDICYSDIFPDTTIKVGNAAMQKWALTGQHFSYLGAGLGGSITGKGGSILIVDDPIKESAEAYNTDRLNTIWSWYTGTFTSRVSADGGEPIEIVNMTRWADADICGKILSGPEKDSWYVLKMEAYNEKTKEMLCPELLSFKRYSSQKAIQDNAIFRANYHQETVNEEGRLYKNLQEYETLPVDKNGKLLFERIVNYTDTADQGTDNLSSIVAGIYKQEAWILDVYYTDEPMEVTEEETAKFLHKNYVEYKQLDVLIESNNGGRGFARNVERIIFEMFKTRKINIDWFHQSENKKARILSNSGYVIKHIYFPKDWSYKYPAFYNAITSYQRQGKNKNDDGPDSLTGIAEIAQGKKKKITIDFI